MSQFYNLDKGDNMKKLVVRKRDSVYEVSWWEFIAYWLLVLFSGAGLLVCLIVIIAALTGHLS